MVLAKGAMTNGIDLACQTMRAKAAAGAETIRQVSKELTDGCMRDASEPPNLVQKMPVARKGSMELLKQMQEKAQAQVQVLPSVLQDKAHVQMQATIQAVSERVDIARQGSQMLSDGGEFAEK